MKQVLSLLQISWSHFKQSAWTPSFKWGVSNVSRCIKMPCLCSLYRMHSKVIPALRSWRNKKVIVAHPPVWMQGPSMKDHKYPAAFPLKHQRKDLELALKYAGSRDQSLPVAAATTDLFKKASTRFATSWTQSPCFYVMMETLQTTSGP